MRPHRVQQSQITTPTGSIPNAYNGYLRIPDSCHLAIEKTLKMEQNILL